MGRKDDVKAAGQDITSEQYIVLAVFNWGKITSIALKWSL
jgi:hypothetical protein